MSDTPKWLRAVHGIMGGLLSTGFVLELFGHGFTGMLAVWAIGLAIWYRRVASRNPALPDDVRALRSLAPGEPIEAVDDEGNPLPRREAIFELERVRDLVDRELRPDRVPIVLVLVGTIAALATLGLEASRWGVGLLDDPLRWLALLIPAGGLAAVHVTRGREAARLDAALEDRIEELRAADGAIGSTSAAQLPGASPDPEAAGPGSSDVEKLNPTTPPANSSPSSDS